MSHRDIKPQNILVDGNGGYKLCDFGNAKLIPPNEDELHTFLGTPLYLSPQLREEFINKMRTLVERRVHYSPYKSDVYSLGLTAVYMCTRSPPTNLAVLDDLQRNTYNLLATLNYSDELKTILLWMLQVDERDRPDFLQLQSYLTPAAVSPQPSHVVMIEESASTAETREQPIKVTTKSNLSGGKALMQPVVMSGQIREVMTEPHKPYKPPSQCCYCHRDITSAYFPTSCQEYTCSEACKQVHSKACQGCRRR